MQTLEQQLKSEQPPTAPSSIASGITDLALAGGIAQQLDSAVDIDPGADDGMRAATTAPSRTVLGITDLALAGGVTQQLDSAVDTDPGADDGMRAATTAPSRTVSGVTPPPLPPQTKPLLGAGIGLSRASHNPRLPA